jgi:hypothetical protein
MGSSFTVTAIEEYLDEDDTLASLSVFIVPHPVPVDLFVSVMEAVLMEEANNDNLFQ